MIDRLLKNNTAAKIIAIFLALMIWFYITGDSREEESSRPFASVPIAVHNLEEYHIVTDMEKEVDLIVRGRSEDLADISPGDLEIFVDLSGLREGEHDVQIRSAAPADLRIQKITPSKMTVVIEEVITSQMEVVPVLEGEPAEGWVTGEVRVEPQNVLVKGNRSKLSLLDETVVIIDIENADEDINRSYFLRALDSQGREIEGLDIQPEEVEVYVEIHLPEAEIPIEVVLEGDLPEGLEVKEVMVQPEKVFLVGMKAVLEDTETVRSSPISLAGRKESFTYEAELEVPSGTSLKTNSNILVNVVIGPADE